MKAIERRISALESKIRSQVFSGPIWCNQERKAALILAIANGREWTCPPSRTPEQIAHRDEKQARFEKWFRELEG